MLTATPINNRLSDFRHMTELFTRREEAYFARTLGVNNLRAHFNNVEKALRSRVGHDLTDIAEHMTEAQEILATDEIFRHLVVQGALARDATCMTVESLSRDEQEGDADAPRRAAIRVPAENSKVIRVSATDEAEAQPTDLLGVYEAALTALREDTRHW